MITYTAIYGSYDPLHDHPEHPDVEEWVCFTDDPTLEAPGWTVVHEPAKYPHPRLSAKWWKCHPPEGDTFWIDGSVWIHNAELIDVVAKCLIESPMTMFAHPWRGCIYPEVDASRGMEKYAGLDLDRQAAHYRAHGWPGNAGLWASTVIGRRDTREVNRFGAAWFAHNEAFTYQDQLSLPYLLARYGIDVAPLPHQLHDNPWFQWMGHNSNA